MEDVIRHYQDGHRFGKADGLLEAAHAIEDFVHKLILQGQVDASVDELLLLSEKLTTTKEDDTDD
jgi:hypothetical protein